jgi:hypothetical protein
MAMSAILRSLAAETKIHMQVHASRRLTERLNLPADRMGFCNHVLAAAALTPLFGAELTYARR